MMCELCFFVETGNDFDWNERQYLCKQEAKHIMRAILFIIKVWYA